MNPTLIVEVLSDSTEEWDRGEKLEHYRRIPSLCECLLVSHRKPEVELPRRGSDGAWTRTVAGSGETLELASIGGSLSVDDVYRRAGLKL